MILTEKAKIDYHNWLDQNKRALRKSYLDDTCEHAIIIEWLDSVGYVVEISTMYYDGWHFTPTLSLPNGDNIIPNMMKESREEATRQAIIRANEIYNNKGA